MTGRINSTNATEKIEKSTKNQLLWKLIRKRAASPPPTLKNNFNKSKHMITYVMSVPMVI